MADLACPCDRCKRQIGVGEKSVCFSILDFKLSMHHRESNSWWVISQYQVISWSPLLTNSVDLCIDYFYIDFKVFSSSAGLHRMVWESQVLYVIWILSAVSLIDCCVVSFTNGFLSHSVLSSLISRVACWVLVSKLKLKSVQNSFMEA